MKALKLLPVILIFLLLAAHFYRPGLIIPTGMCIALPVLLLVRESWVPRVLQAMLMLGALEWLRTLYLYAGERMAIGQSWTRLAIILGAVALFTALSGLVFRNKTLRSRYAREDAQADA
jgi:hypothetical protein